MVGKESSTELYVVTGAMFVGESMVLLKENIMFKRKYKLASGDRKMLEDIRDEIIRQGKRVFDYDIIDENIILDIDMGKYELRKILKDLGEKGIAKSIENLTEKQ